MAKKTVNKKDSSPKANGAKVAGKKGTSKKTAESKVPESKKAVKKTVTEKAVKPDVKRKQSATRTKNNEMRQTLLDYNSVQFTAFFKGFDNAGILRIERVIKKIKPKCNS